MRKDKVIIIIISILGVLFLGMGITLLYYYEMIKIKSVEIVDYDKQNDKVSIDVYIDNKLPSLSRYKPRRKLPWCNRRSSQQLDIN